MIPRLFRQCKARSAAVQRRGGQANRRRTRLPSGRTRTAAGHRPRQSWRARLASATLPARSSSDCTSSRISGAAGASALDRRASRTHSFAGLGAARSYSHPTVIRPSKGAQQSGRSSSPRSGKSGCRPAQLERMGRLSRGEAGPSAFGEGEANPLASSPSPRAASRDRARSRAPEPRAPRTSASIWSPGCNEPPVTLRPGAHGAA